MEEIHHRAVKGPGLRRSMVVKTALSLLVLAFASTPAASQVGTGGVFLSLLKGARQQSVSGAAAGVLDDNYAFYTNPGATGFMRAWGWSATYTRWIADVRNISLVYGRGIRTPWSRRTRFALGLAYQGVPEFNSTGETAATASASDLLVTLAAGQPLRTGAHTLSVGLNAKYMRSQLERFRADAFTLDAGLMFRSRRFALAGRGSGWFEEGILTAGVGLTNVGRGLRYLEETTRLPRALQAGLGFYAGVHDGVSVQFSLDYLMPSLDSHSFRIGAEIGVREAFALRFGWDTHPALVSHFTFGTSLALDRHKGTLGDMAPPSNHALRFDMASGQGNDVFERTFTGGASYYPVSPEPFELTTPVFGSQVLRDSVDFAWEASFDPDLYDDVRYLLLADQDRTVIQRDLETLRKSPVDFAATPRLRSAHVIRELDSTAFRAADLDAGQWHWSVIAFDKDAHYAVARQEGREIASFTLPAPDLELTDIRFDYSPWITQDDLQGSLTVKVTNRGPRTARNSEVVILASPEAHAAQDSAGSVTIRDPAAVLSTHVIDTLAVGESRTVQLEWRTRRAGAHLVQAGIAGNRAGEYDISNNYGSRLVHTIPKGRIFTGDTVLTRMTATYFYDFPFFPDVFFDSSSADLAGQTLDQRSIDPSMERLAQRLISNPKARIQIRGYADPNSGERDPALARARAENVSDYFLNSGVAGSQIQLLPGVVREPRRRPADPSDAQWIFQERRNVRITADAVSQSLLFSPTAHADSEHVHMPLTVATEVMSAMPVRAASLRLRTGELSDILPMETVAGGKALSTGIEWSPRGSAGGAIVDWAETDITYDLTVIDSLGRTFRTRDQSVYLALASRSLDHKIIWPMKFGEAAPLYEFYWEKLYTYVEKMLRQEDMHMRFVGHACAIGPESVNERLSRRRASVFQQRFLNFVKTRHSEAYAEVLPRLDEARGMGESVPLRVQHRFCDLNLHFGNETPVDRKFNRRIEIVFYGLEKPKESFGEGYNLARIIGGGQ